MNTASTLTPVTTSTTLPASLSRSGPGIASVLAKAIAHPEDRLDVPRLGGIRLDFRAQVANVDVDGALGAFVVGEPVQQVLPGEDPARRGCQDAHQLELGRREIDQHAGHFDAPGAPVDG